MAKKSTTKKTKRPAARRAAPKPKLKRSARAVKAVTARAVRANGAKGTPADDELALLRQLSNAVAVSGDEGAVRRIILDTIRPLTDEVKVDAVGNVLAVKKAAGRASRNGARVLVAAHMDEVGFMVAGHESDGTLRFETVGSVDDRLWIGKPVWVRSGANNVLGVISAAPVHLLNSDRRNSVVKANQLRIDLGVETAEAAKRLVKVGERGTFATELDVLGGVALRDGTSLRGKALDDRLGCAALVELLRGGPYPFELHAAFTVQEEVGVRGAKVAAYAVDPACAFILDCTPAHDLPHSDPEKENVEYNARLGLGPAIYVADRATISDQRLIKHLRKTAAGAGIPYQIRQPGGGGTDAGAVHRSRAGVPSVSVSVPGRYLHGPAAIARLDDWRNTLTLMRAALENWTPKVMK